MINDKLRNDYLHFQKNNQKQNIVDLLQTFLETENYSDMDQCWALWNISDNLAMLRKSKDEYNNHKIFEKQLLNMDTQYLHWIVSDATQKLTLIKGGYEDFWNELYVYACNHAPKTVENQRIRFESHRATVSTPAIEKYSFNKETSFFALENIKDMLVQLKDNQDFLYYELTYYTLNIGLNSLLGINSTEIFENSLLAFDTILYHGVSGKDKTEENNFLLGSWQQLNAMRSNYNQAKVGIGNYIISLIYAREYRLALKCYEKIKPHQFEFGSYFYKQIAFAQSQFGE